MLIANDIAARNEISDAVLCISNQDGSWTVYMLGDEIPAKYSWIFES